MLPTVEQPTLDGLPGPDEVAFDAYHDESGNFGPPGGGDRWLLHGLLFVPEAHKTKILESLTSIREREKYWNELHFVNLRQADRGPKANCARGWLDYYFRSLAEYCPFYCRAVDTASPAFDRNRFPTRSHAYNRFAKMAFDSAIPWSLKQQPKVALRILSDAKTRSQADKFETYVPREVLETNLLKHCRKPSSYPSIRLVSETVIMVDSDPCRYSGPRIECEMIQMVDLITSAIAQALTGRSGQKAKILLGEIVADWVDDTRRPP